MKFRIAVSLFLSVACAGQLATPVSAQSERWPSPAGYDALVSLFSEWRGFQAPVVRDGVPDYTESALAEQARLLPEYRARLASIDTTNWPIVNQIDYHLVQAEMNGLDFDLRVRRPWARDPAFYVMVFPSQTDVLPREGPVIHGAIELWQYALPLSADRSAELAERLVSIAPLLDQAKVNLTGNARDLWNAGIRRMQRQSSDLLGFANAVGATDATLAAAARTAQAATDEFVVWLQQEAPSKTEPSGLGEDNYTWNLQEVHLVPYTWAEEVTLMWRELMRAHASLRLEEHRNRDLPPLAPAATAAEYDRARREAITRYMRFLDEAEILTVEDYMEPALLARVGTFNPAGPPHFFSQVDYREPLIMRTHHFHWFDLARMEQDPHPSPIRRVPLLYNIYDSRAEGMATGMEEMMMHAGLLDGSPRSRELVWIMLAQRAARALGGLYLHANIFTMDEAKAFAVKWTPRGWLNREGGLVHGEQHLYLQQPAYGTSYVVGKIDIEKLLGEWGRDGQFEMRAFMDAFTAAGVIPVSLIRWQLTGRRDEIDRMTKSP